MPKKLIPNRQSSARKKSEFYTKVMDEAEKLDFETAEGIEGIDNEITIMRVRIKRILENDPDNTAQIMAATNLLAKLVRTRYNITKEQKKGLKEAIGDVLTQYAMPLGAAMMGKKW